MNIEHVYIYIYANETTLCTFVGFFPTFVSIVRGPGSAYIIMIANDDHCRGDLLRQSTANSSDERQNKCATD